MALSGRPSHLWDIHSDNRISQELFLCLACGNADNADKGLVSSLWDNAQKVIAKRAIKLILNSGTELSKRGVLLDTGRGAKNKAHKPKGICAHGCEASKKKELGQAA